MELKDKADERTREQIQEHYQIEKELANRLRQASKEQRRQLYPLVYDELFRRVPSHSMLIRKASAEETQKAAAAQMKFLRRFLKPDDTFLEVGPGDCALSFAVAAQVKRVFAVDVSSKITDNARQPSNFQLILSDGCAIPLPAESVQVAYSNQLMEHLHPEDAFEQLQAIYRALAPGGIYICITPNRVGGPYDISRHFDKVATGFHLKEYTWRELSELFRRVGFSQVWSYMGIKGNFHRFPLLLFQFCEASFALLPHGLRQVLADALPMRLFLRIWIVGAKA